jgi:hypothetical protein
MATLQELREFNERAEAARNAPIAMPKVKQKKEEAPIPSIANKSPLNIGERTQFAMIGEDPNAKKGLLKAMGFGADQILDPASSPTKGWAIYDKEKEAVFPVDEKGFGMGDVAEIIPGAAKAVAGTAGAVGGGAIGLFGGGVGSVPGAILGGAAATGGTEYGLQKIVRMMYGNKDLSKLSPEERKAVERVNAGEVAMETAGGAVGGMLPGSSNLVSAGLGKQTFKQGLKKWGAGIVGKQIKSQPASAVTKKALTKAIAVVDPLKGELSEQTLKDVVGNKYVRDRTQTMMTKETETLVGNAANSVKRFFDKGIKKASNEIYKDIPKDVPLNVGEAVYAVGGKLDEFMASATKSQQKDVEKLSKIMQEATESVSPDGTLPFNKLKAFTNDLFETAEKLKKSGNNTVAAQYSKAGHLLNEAKNSDMAIKDASGKFADLKKVEDFFKNITSIHTERGEINLQQKLMSMSKNDGVRKEIDEVYKIFQRNPELRKYTRMMDKIKLAQAATDIKSAKAVKPSGEWINRVPLLKELNNLNPFTSPEEQMKMMALGAKKGIIKPAALEGTVERSNIPGLGNMITKYRAQKALFGNPAITPTPTGLIPSMIGSASQSAWKHKQQLGGRAAIASMIQQLTKPR